MNEKSGGTTKRIYVPKSINLDDLIERGAASLMSKGIQLRPYGARLAWTDSDVIVKALQVLVGDLPKVEGERTS